MIDIKKFKKLLSPRALKLFSTARSVVLRGKASARVRRFFKILPPELLLRERPERKTPAQWVEIAKKLARQRGGGLFRLVHLQDLEMVEAYQIPRCPTATVINGSPTATSAHRNINLPVGENLVARLCIFCAFLSGRGGFPAKGFNAVSG